MFSGIVETTGVISAIAFAQDCMQLTITPKFVFDDIAIGDSVAINGVCLTITEIYQESFKVTAVPETLRLTNLDLLKVGGVVNLERSLKISSRIGGHYVQGHVDGKGEILEIKKDGKAAWLVKINVAAKLAKLIVPKGYVAIDGMSITAIEVSQDWFTVTLIPHTQAVTISNHYKVGSLVNIEVDILGKYVEKILGAQHALVQA